MFGGDVCCPSSVNCHLKLGELFCIVEGIVSGYLVSSDKGKMASRKRELPGRQRTGACGSYFSLIPLPPPLQV